MDKITRRALLGASAAIPASSLLNLITPQTVMAAEAGVLDSLQLFDTGNYIAQGTVFTRSVANMPLAGNSAALASAMSNMPAEYGGKSFPWLKTSLNTESYNIPIYLVDSRVKGCPTKSFTVDHYECAKDPLVHGSKIPCPSHAIPAYGGDMSLAIYDIGTGILREYFHCEKTSTGYAAGTAGWTQLGAPLSSKVLASKNFSMQVTKGSSAVVKMHNPLSQVGLREIQNGVINHAVSFTFANAAPGSSWPAKQGDGNYSKVAPVQGQWFRLPPSLDLASLNLNPFTLMVARAVQRYGGYGADKNTWCHSVNVESAFTKPGLTASSVITPVLQNFRHSTDYGTIVNDFPWHLTEWAQPNWQGSAQASPMGAAYKYSGWTRSVTGKLTSTGTTTTAPYDLRCDAVAAAGQTATISWTWAPQHSGSSRLNLQVFPRSGVNHSEVKLSVYVAGKLVDSCSSRKLKTLNFWLNPGKNKIEFRFTLAGLAAGKTNDVLALGPAYPKPA